MLLLLLRDELLAVCSGWVVSRDRIGRTRGKAVEGCCTSKANRGIGCGARDDGRVAASTPSITHIEPGLELGQIAVGLEQMGHLNPSLLPWLKKIKRPWADITHKALPPDHSVGGIGQDDGFGAGDIVPDLGVVQARPGERKFGRNIGSLEFEE